MADELRANPAEAARGIQKLVLLREHGWPPLRSLTVEKVADNPAPVHILKATPSCWRFYFHADVEARSLTLLHCVCKKKQKREEADVAAACRALRRLRIAELRSRPMPLPER